MRYLNHYYCPDCDVAWSDEWSCCCDDECPECGIAYTPTHSDDLDDDDLNDECGQGDRAGRP